MERSRIIHYISIAVTALSLTACVLLIALWVRSYWWWDEAEVLFFTETDSPRLYFGQAFVWGSADGVVSFYKFLDLTDDEGFQWTIDSERRHPDTPRDYVTNESWYFNYQGDLGVNVPHWFLVALIAAFGICPWIHWSKRFSLRTLLIATTLVAVGLGVVIWAAK
jgi:hypothetical protein